MAVGDIYKATLKSLLKAQECENVFYFAVDTDPGSTSSATVVGGLVRDTFVPLLTAVQSDQLQYTEVQVQNIMQIGDFTTLAVTDTGAVSGDVMPTYVAFGFSYNRGLRLGNNGRKAFAGVPESSVVDGVVTDSGVLAALGDLASELGATHVLTGVTYRPIIYRIPDPDHVNGTAFPVGSVTYKRITTQNSRKVGRGI